MMSHTGRESAKIIPFPGKHRLHARAARPVDDAVVELRARQIPVCDYGSGWYHEAAIQEELRGRKP